MECEASKVLAQLLVLFVGAFGTAGFRARRRGVLGHIDLPFPFLHGTEQVNILGGPRSPDGLAAYRFATVFEKHLGGFCVERFGELGIEMGFAQRDEIIDEGVFFTIDGFVALVVDAGQEFKFQDEATADEGRREHPFFVGGDDDQWGFGIGFRDDRIGVTGWLQLPGTEDFEQAVRDTRLGLIDFIDKDDDPVFGFPVLGGLGHRGRGGGQSFVVGEVCRFPIDRPPEGSWEQEFFDIDFFTQSIFGIGPGVLRCGLYGFDCFYARGFGSKSEHLRGDLGFGQTFDGVEGPQEVLGLGACRDGIRDEFSAQEGGGGVGQLGFAQPWFTAHEQWTVCGRGASDGLFVDRIEQVLEFCPTREPDR